MFTRNTGFLKIVAQIAHYFIVGGIVQNKLTSFTCKLIQIAQNPLLFFRR